jgi:aldehyde:ferredoxin oxidoreductase
MSIPGYAGQLLRVDLTNQRSWTQPFDSEFARKYVGGAGFGARILYDEVPADVAWDDPDNRLIMATGPMAGSVSWGTSNMCVVTRGPMTNGATSTQANGFFGHCLKFSGYDGIVFQGISERWVYLFIDDDHVELRDATHLLGMDTWQLQDTLMIEHGRAGHQMSVYGIGVSGENRVRFAAIEGDYGHVASKNGCGAVLGNKRVKAVAIVRGTRGLPMADPPGVWRAADALSENIKTSPAGSGLYRYGTLPGFTNLAALGALPIKNYTTNIYQSEEALQQFAPENLRGTFPHRGHQCSACGMHHCMMQTLPSGRHAGELADEPEYEGWSGCGATIGCTDPVAVSWLNTQVDRAGVDVNEFGWVCGWTMEGYEKGWITKDMLGGLEIPWGDAEAAAKLLWMIARREGFGDVLAEGVKRAAEKLGGDAYQAAVFTMKGATPRGHDHRSRREEMFDTCLSSNATFEIGLAVDSAELNVPARIESFNPVAMPETLAKIFGRRHFEDSIGVCTFTNTVSLATTLVVVNAITGWDMSVAEAMIAGRRTGLMLRAFNLRCGIGPEQEYPSPRYGGIPVDGPAKGVDAMAVWEQMRDVYYDGMGWDRASGKPLPETLNGLGLEDIRAELWSSAPVATGGA